MVQRAQTWSRNQNVWAVLFLGGVTLAACSSKNPGTSSAGNTAAVSGTSASGNTSGTTAAAGTNATTTAGTNAGSGGRAAPPATNAGTGTPATAGRGTAAGSGSAMAGRSGGTSGTGSTPSTAGTSAQPPSTNGAASVLQYHNNAARNGMYVDTAFTREAAGKIKKDPTFKAMVTGATYAQPLYFEGGPDGKDLVIVATEQNEVTAFNAADGAVVWRKMVAPPNSNGSSPCGNITPLGITGTPVIDAASRTLYLDAATSGPKNQVFALSIDDGSTRSGFPVDIDTVKAGSRSFNSSVQNQRGALLIVDKTLYVPFGGRFGDCGDYNGWVVGVPLDNPSGLFAFATVSHGAGIWTPGGLASDGTSIYAATGNSKADGGGVLSTPTSWGHGNAVLRLSKDLKDIPQSATKDFFAAQNWSQLDTQDYDIGGSGPVLFSVPGSTPSELIMALGKEGAAYLLDRANLGGMGGMIQRKMVAGGGINGGLIQAAAAYTTPTGTFVAFRAAMSAMGCGSGSGFLGAIKVSGSPPSMNVAWCAGSNGSSSPIVTSTDGMNETVVWYMAGGKLLGHNGETGEPVFAGGGADDGLGTVNKFQTAIAAKGRIFVAAGSAVLAFTVK